MLDKVNQDIKEAMKARQKERLNALRMLKSAFIENNTAKKPKELSEVAIAHVKKLRDSLEAYPENSLEAAKISAEIAFLKDYVPQPLSEEEVKSLAQEIIKGQDEVNFGIVMKALSPQIKGKFDGKRASQIVKELTS